MKNYTRFFNFDVDEWHRTHHRPAEYKNSAPFHTFAYIIATDYAMDGYTSIGEGEGADYVLFCQGTDSTD